VLHRSGRYCDLAYMNLCDIMVLWVWIVVNFGVLMGGTSNSTILHKGCQTVPGHKLAGIALHPAISLCQSRRWRRGEPGGLAKL